MAAWIIPALKAVLPHVGTIIAAASPVFTKKGSEEKQIAELQAVVAQNARNIKELAAQLETTVAAFEQAASIAEASLRRLRLMSAAALALSTAAMIAVIFIR